MAITQKSYAGCSFTVSQIVFIYFVYSVTNWGFLGFPRALLQSLFLSIG